MRFIYEYACAIIRPVYVHLIMFYDRATQAAACTRYCWFPEVVHYLNGRLAFGWNNLEGTGEKDM